MKQCCMCGGWGHSPSTCRWNTKEGCKTCGRKTECARVECSLRKPVTVDCSSDSYERSNGGYKRRTGGNE